MTLLKQSTLAAALCLAFGGAAFAQTSAAPTPPGTPAATAPSAGAIKDKTGGTASPGAASQDKAGTAASPGATTSHASDSGPASSANADSVRQAQQMLSDKGLYSGQVDGVMGPKTRAALKEFQQKQGMPASGQLDDATLTALGGAGGAPGGSDSSGKTPSGSSTTPDATPAGTGGAAGGPGMSPPNADKAGTTGNTPGGSTSSTPSSTSTPGAATSGTTSTPGGSTGAPPSTDSGSMGGSSTAPKR